MRTEAGSPGRKGMTLVELVVSLVLLSMGLTLTARLLWEARRSLDRSELGLRATLLLGELAGADEAAPDSLQRPSRMGTLSGMRYADGELRVVLVSGADPPEHDGQRNGAEEVEGSRMWRILPDARSGDE